MTTPAVVLPIGPDRYAVLASTVREVVADPRPTRLPTAPAVILGVFNLRGEVVPMFDTAALLGMGRVDAAPLVVVLNTVAGPVGLAATGLPEVALLEAAVRPSELRGTSGVYATGAGVVVLLDVEALLLPHTSLPASGLAGATVTDAMASR